MHLGDRSIFLIGYRGTGKTTVARLLAERLGWDWIDADEEIERRADKTIAAIFADEGEAAFRQLEASTIEELCRWRRSVVSLGGGAVLNEANRTAIRLGGIVIWLTASIETIASRLAADEKSASQRPNLTAAGGMTEIETVLATREPIYRACATLEVDTEEKTPEAIVEEILARLEGRGIGEAG